MLFWNHKDIILIVLKCTWHVVIPLIALDQYCLIHMRRFIDVQKQETNNYSDF